MKTLQERANVREQLVKSAKDATVDKLSKLYLSQHRSDLEHLQDGQQVPGHVPVGKDKFVKWVKDAIDSFYPTARILIDNAELLRNFALQVADTIAKSSTSVVNPMKDYKVSKDPVFVKANKEVYVKVAKVPNELPEQPANEYSGSLKTPNLHTAPVEHSRYCPEHPGAMMRRVSDNVYQCPIGGDLNLIEPWKEKYDYRGGHEVRFETGVQNQTSQGPNRLHPTLPFLHHEAEKSDTIEKGKPYDFEKLYGVSAEPEERQDQKLASQLLSKLTKIAEDKACSKCGMKDCPCMAAGKECHCESNDDFEVTPAVPMASSKLLSKKAQSYKTQQLFGPTTIMSRQCPDHPGQQLSRLADNVRQCPLDGKTYDYVRGFTTEDGEKHNGGTVQAQGSIPPGSILVKVKNASTKEAGRNDIVADNPTTHEFLYSILQHLPGSAEKERKILNYKFQKNVTLEQAIQAIKQAEELAAHPQLAQQPAQASPAAPGTTPAMPATASSEVKSFVRG